MKQTVEPIRSKQQIKQVEEYLAKKSKRNRLLLYLAQTAGYEFQIY